MCEKVPQKREGSVASVSPTQAAAPGDRRGGRQRGPRRGTGAYHLMLLPGVVVLFAFTILPLAGLVLAFQDFQPELGVWNSPWVGFDNFTTFLFVDPEIAQIFINTVVIAVAKILLGLAVPVIFALLLNELRQVWYKRVAQTVVYLPHFMSWVILGGIFLQLFSLTGMVNQVLSLVGIHSIFFLQSNFWMRPIIIGTDTWKEFGFGTIVYLAALTSIDPALYEAAAIDGCGRRQSIRYITLPGLSSTIVLLGTLSLGNVLNANFDQIYNMYNPTVYPSVDIIDSWVYREGLGGAMYSIGVAVSMLKAGFGFVLIILSYKLAARFAGYSIF
jgi:putative aldouronate transport system permease protein